MPFDPELLKSLISAGGDKVAALIKGRADAFLDARKDSADFLTGRSRRLVELAVELEAAATVEERERVKASMEVVTDAITSECWSIATDLSAATRSTITAIVGTVKDFLIEALPIVGKVLLAAI